MVYVVYVNVVNCGLAIRNNLNNCAPCVYYFNSSLTLSPHLHTLSLSSSPLSSLHSFLLTLPLSFPSPPATEDVFDGMEGFEADNERDYTPFSQSDDDSLLTDGELKRSRSGLQVKHLTNNPSWPCFCSVVGKYLYFVQHLNLCYISVLGCEVYVFSVRQGPFTRHCIRTYVRTHVLNLACCRSRSGSHVLRIVSVITSPAKPSCHMNSEGFFYTS